jgi:hypothetical protein
MNRYDGLSYELGENEFTDLTHEEFVTTAARGADREGHEESGGDDVMVITTRAGDVHQGSRLANGMQ